MSDDEELAAAGKQAKVHVAAEMASLRFDDATEALIDEATRLNELTDAEFLAEIVSLDGAAATAKAAAFHAATDIVEKSSGEESAFRKMARTLLVNRLLDAAERLLTPPTKARAKSVGLLGRLFGKRG